MIEYGNVRVSVCLCGFHVISYEQTTQTIHLKHSQPLSVCLSCSSLRQLPAPVCTKLRSKAPVAVTNVLASCDGKPALSTHTEASTKLITAHQAHHCDHHARARPGIIIDSRSTVERAVRAVVVVDVNCIIYNKSITNSRRHL